MTTMTGERLTENRRVTALELALALRLRVDPAELPARLRQLKGSDSLRQLSATLTEAYRVPISHMWLSRYFRAHPADQEDS